MARTHIRPLSALSLAAALAGGAVLPCQARAADAPRPPRVVPCPAGTVCDSALGVALALPAGWTQDNYPTGILEFSARPTAGAPDRGVRLDVASWGMTSDRDDARVAAAGMDALIRSTNSARSFARVPVHVAGASGVLVSGLPGAPGPVTAIILAHGGVAYKLLAPGTTLAPDQVAALRSLRFIPRTGPFPPANGVGVPSRHATASRPSLFITCNGPNRAVVTCQLAGRGFPPRERVRITYNVSTGAGSPTAYRLVRLAYQRITATDSRGSFVRPPLRVVLDPRILSYHITVTVLGENGERVTAGAGGAP